MIKEQIMYEALDGKMYKTKKGAENHNNSLEFVKAMKRVDMTKDEIQEKLEEIAHRKHVVDIMLRKHKHWTKFPDHIIKTIDHDLFAEPKRKTLYIREYRGWGKTEEKILFTEEGKEFTNPELHTKDEYKVERIEVVDKYTKKVFYEDKYTTEEIATRKLKKGIELTEDEISSLLMCFDTVHEEEGEGRRWSKWRLSVIEVDNVLYAIEWDEGLTEMQENSYLDQPYKVELETKEVVVTKTKVKRL